MPGKCKQGARACTPRKRETTKLLSLSRAQDRVRKSPLLSNGLLHARAAEREKDIKEEYKLEDASSSIVHRKRDKETKKTY